MDFWEWFWSLFSGEESRAGEEKKELKDEKESEKLTKEEIHDEKKEEGIEHRILEELHKIRKELSKEELKLAIQIKTHSVTLEEALLVLSIHIQKLIHTGASIKGEEQTLERIVNYWRVVRQGLKSSEVQKDASKIDPLFEEIGILLKDEDKIIWQKIQLVRKEYDLIMQESIGQKAPKGKPSNKGKSKEKVEMVKA